jgi:hypothetical protein
MKSSTRSIERPAATTRSPDTDAGGWPIGVIVAAHWVAHKAGTQPNAGNMIEAVEQGLIELGDPWTLTAQGRAALAAHGWL